MAAYVRSASLGNYAEVAQRVGLDPGEMIRAGVAGRGHILDDVFGFERLKRSSVQPAVVSRPAPRQ